MSIADIELALTVLSEHKFNSKTFPFEFIEVFDVAQSTVTKLRQGHTNKAIMSGDLLWQKNLFYRTAQPGKATETLDALMADPLTMRWKPRFLLTTDGVDLRARDLKTDDIADLALVDLPKACYFFMPLAGHEKYRVLSENPADVKATGKLALLYDEILNTNPEWKGPKRSHDLDQLMTRLLFCFFAEDTSIFEKKQFVQTLVTMTKDDGSDVALFLDAVFAIMDIDARARTGGADWLLRFPYVNGGLFKAKIELPSFSARARRLLKDCGDLDWGAINPDIFGSMIQSIVDKKLRGDLGMHYTSVPNIMKALRPLFLDSLEVDFARAWDDLGKLERLLVRIRAIRVFDPACGSGNFLIIAYKELRKLETRIFERMMALSKQFALPMSEVNLNHFCGIEYADFAAETAKLSLWIAKHQMDEHFKTVFPGASIPSLPLKEGGQIICGNATRIDWTTACAPATRRVDGKEPDGDIYIVGNPPYVGRAQQTKDHKADMAHIFAGRLRSYKKLDYVACWLAKAADYCSSIQASCAFVTTNSICQGEQVPIFWPSILQKNIEIGFAHQSFKWKNNATKNAGVTCVIIGLRRVGKGKKMLFANDMSKVASNINPYLVDSDNVFVLPVSNYKTRFPIMRFGNMANDDGNLLLTRDQRDSIVSKYPESLVIFRRIYGSRELIHDIERYCLWIDEDNLALALSVPEIATRIENVRLHRAKSDRDTTKELASCPHRFAEVRTGPSSGSVIIIPSVSSESRPYIPIDVKDGSCVVSNLAFSIYNSEVWVFSMISSRLHVLWTAAVGGQLETRLRYSNTLVYNTFPMSDLSATQKALLEERAMAIITARENHAGRTLAWLYDPKTMPKDLEEAHKELDDTLETIMVGKPIKTDTERLEHLFRLYAAQHSTKQEKAA